MKLTVTVRISFAVISLLSVWLESEVIGTGTTDNENNCTTLLMGQFKCLPPKIDAETQQPEGCTKEKPFVKVNCLPAPGITCNGTLHNGSSVGFTKDVACKPTNGHSFETALLLSIFLGMFGIDRFYLGYPAIGLLKFCTLGFMFLGQLVDIVLIAMQVVGPSDGSSYVIDYYGAAVTKLQQDKDTYFLPPPY